MKTSMCSLVLGMLAMLGVLSLSGCGQGYDAEVVYASDGVLSFREAGGESKVLPVAADAEVTLDGQPVQLEVLAPGDKLDVDIEVQEGNEVATRVAARSSETEANEQDAKDPEQSEKNPDTPPTDPVDRTGPEEGLEPLPR